MALRYWVGGTDLWDTTAGTKWALTSGGAGGQSVPTSSDDVFFDGASGSGTVTLSGTCACRDLFDTSFGGNFDAASATLNISRAVHFSANVAVNPTVNMLASTAVTTANVDIYVSGATGKGTVIFNGTGSWTGAVVRCKTLTLTKGALSISSMDVDSFTTAGTNTRSLTLTAAGAAAYNIYSAWTISTTTGLTFTANSSILNLGSSGMGAGYVSGNVTFTGGGLTYYTVVRHRYSTTATTTTVAGSNSFSTFDGEPPSNATSTYEFEAGTTNTFGAIVNMSGNSATYPTAIRSKTAATHTLVYSGVGVVSLNYVNITNSTATPAATWFAGIGSTDLGGNTGWSFTNASNGLFFGSNF